MMTQILKLNHQDCLPLKARFRSFEKQDCSGIAFQVTPQRRHLDANASKSDTRMKFSGKFVSLYRKGQTILQLMLSG